MRLLCSLPLAALALGALPAQAAVLAGNVKVRGAGCQGIKLIPRTAEAEREIVRMFGTTEASAVKVAEPQLHQAAANKSLGTDTLCGGWSANYRFNNVAPGNYFMTVALVSVKRERGLVFGEPLFYGPSRITKTYLMQPVRIEAADRVVRIDFTRR